MRNIEQQTSQTSNHLVLGGDRVYGKMQCRAEEGDAGVLDFNIVVKVGLTSRKREIGHGYVGNSRRSQ